MSSFDEQHFFKLVKERSGLVLTPAKAYLVQSRLQSIAAEEKVADVPALLARLRMTNAEPLIRRCVDAMATHETFFFRDSTPFDQLRRALPAIIARRKATRTLRLWSAACSSGQEPYSLAMLLQEFAGSLSGWRIEIMATDMSESVLAKARSARYSAFETGRGLTEPQRDRWMVKADQHWEVSPAIRAAVTFRRHNLLDSPSSLGGAFDVVFCRNVLIYFEQADKGRVLDGLGSVTATDGLLFLGSAESVFGLTDRFEAAPESRGCYLRKDPTGERLRA